MKFLVPKKNWYKPARIIYDPAELAAWKRANEGRRGMLALGGVVVVCESCCSGTGTCAQPCNTQRFLDSSGADFAECLDSWDVGPSATWASVAGRLRCTIAALDPGSTGGLTTAKRTAGPDFDEFLDDCRAFSAKLYQPTDITAGDGVFSGIYWGIPFGVQWDTSGAGPPVLVSMQDAASSGDCYDPGGSITRYAGTGSYVYDGVEVMVLICHTDLVPDTRIRRFYARPAAGSPFDLIAENTTNAITNRKPAACFRWGAGGGTIGANSGNIIEYDDLEGRYTL